MDKFTSSEELLYFCKSDKKILVDFLKNPMLSPQITQKVEVLQKNAPLIPIALDTEKKKLEKIKHLMMEINTSLEELKFSIERKTLKVFNPHIPELLSKPIKKALQEIMETQKMLQVEIEENIVLLKLIENYLKSLI